MLAAAVLFTVQTAARGDSAAYAQCVDAAVLKQGSRGQDVKTVQEKLKRWGYYSGSVDGIYGPQTKKAVEYFQRKNGLKADGIVGKATFAALGMMEQAGQGNSSQPSQNGYTNSDTYLLARCIYGEATGENIRYRSRLWEIVQNFFAD